MASLFESVGVGGVNRRGDVHLAQMQLNGVIGSLSLGKLLVDGQIGPATINAILEFQRRIVKMQTPDGRIEPGGATHRQLSGLAPLPTKVALTEVVAYKASVPPARRLVSEYSMQVLQMAAKEAGVTALVITSTLRTPDEQAGIMYDNAKISLPKQFQLYGSNGDQVLKVFKSNQAKPRDEVVGLMEDKIHELLKQGKLVSKHVVTSQMYAALNIVDIGVNSTKAAAGKSFDKAAVLKAFLKLKRVGYIKEVIDETAKSNNCWHLEIVPNGKSLPSEAKV